MTFRKYLAWTIAVALLLYGQYIIPHSWPLWLVISCMILTPIAIWFLVGWRWRYLKPSKNTEILLNRILSGIICIVLYTQAVLYATSKTHIENTQWVQTRDGREAVGDDIVVEGPAWGNALLSVSVAFCFLWYGVLRKPVKNEDGEIVG